MQAKTIHAIYFSPTGTTKKIVSHIAGALDPNFRIFDFTLPPARQEPKEFQGEDLVVCGLPVYAGRVPNLLLPYLNTLKGNGALAVPVVLYGNRNFDDALIELKGLLQSRGFQPIAAAAFVGEHAFSRILAAHRPDEADLHIAKTFAERIRDNLQNPNIDAPLKVAGRDPLEGYYQPKDSEGNPIDIRKVKPKTKDCCNDCKRCVQLCPMGSIDPNQAAKITGICIKCGACIKGCPQEAKYYDDPGYLYHLGDLEARYTRRAEPELFF